MKNILVGLLVLVVVFMGIVGFMAKRNLIYRRLGLMVTPTPTAVSNSTPTPTTSIKGMKLSDSPISKNAYKVAPGVLSPDAQKAMMGWNINTQTMRDGSLIVTLTPKDSDDQKQQYTLAKGDSLYFVETFPGDDQKDKDQNLHDDYGIVTDSNGVVK